jgi:ATP-dependent Lon protease
MVLAAYRAGLKTVVMPKKNLKDLVDVPKRARSEMKIVPVEHIDQVLEVALVPAPENEHPPRPRRKKTATLPTEAQPLGTTAGATAEHPAE